MLHHGQGPGNLPARAARSCGRSVQVAVLGIAILLLAGANLCWRRPRGISATVASPGGSCLRTTPGTDRLRDGYERDAEMEGDFPQPYPLYDKPGGALLPAGNMGQVPSVTATPASAVGELSVWLEELHYCFVGGPCVCGGRLMIRGAAGECSVGLRNLGTRRACMYLTQDSRQRVRDVLSYYSHVSGLDATMTGPARIYDLLARHVSGNHPQAARDLNLAVFQLVHDALDSDARPAQASAL